MKYDVITIGSASRDVFLNSSEFKILDNNESSTGQMMGLPLGSKMEIKKIVFATGGSGTNTAVTFARQGLKTACAVILVNDGGERTILSYKGEGQHFEASQISFDQLEADWVMLGSLGGHYDLFEKAVNWATTHSVKIALNPGTKELALGLEKLKPFLKQCAVVSMNQEEAAQLLGLEFNKEDEIFKAMDKIVEGMFIMTK